MTGPRGAGQAHIRSWQRKWRRMEKERRWEGKETELMEMKVLLGVGKKGLDFYKEGTFRFLGAKAAHSESLGLTIHRVDAHNVCLV